MISVLIPSRKRPASLKKSVNSLRNLAAGDIEILVGADPDDSETVTTAKKLDASANKDKELKRYFDQAYRENVITDKFSTKEKLLRKKKKLLS